MAIKIRPLLRPIPEPGCLRVLAVLWSALLVGACAEAPPAPPPPDVHAMVKAIVVAGRRETSGFQVKPLRNPAVKGLVRRSAKARKAGKYALAARLLDRALARDPHAPDLLQDRAELAIYLRHYKRAEQLARASWKQGPRLGGLCARNWQTVMEMRYVAHDPAGVAAARKRRDACRVKPVIRM